MLISDSRLSNSPVMSLHAGGRIGSLKKPIINPANLRIIAYEIAAQQGKDATYLLTSDIREYGSLGAIIDMADDFISPGDVIKLDELIALNFTLIGMAVHNEDGKKLGKVSGYTVETVHFDIQQLQVKGGILQSLRDTTGLIIHRSQIIEINNTAIIVKSTKEKSAEPVSTVTRGAFINPFRPAHPPQPESSSVTSP